MDEVSGGRHGMYAYRRTVRDAWAGRGLMVVGELFTPRKGALTQQLDAVYINGAWEAECYEQGWGFKLQTPAEAKAFVSNEKLKRVGWYTVGMDHGRDATRHLLLWLCTTPEGRAMGGEELLRRIVDPR